jgi:hypothetical protein
VRKAANVEQNGFHPRLHSDRGGDHLLLGDEHLEEPLRVRLREQACVEFDTSPSSATTSGGSEPSAASASP